MNNHKKQHINNKKLIFVILIAIFAVYFIINLAIYILRFSFNINIEGFFWNFNDNIKIEQEHTNVLIAGIGGENHDGGNLTDTLIFASYNHTKKNFFMLSIPRDLFYKDDLYANKINEIYAISVANKNPDPVKDLKNAVSKIVNKPIHYYVIVDFNGFVELINAIGGITVNVDIPFTDNMYPTNDYKWKTVSFKAGPQVMSGERALEYVRSRHAKGIAGSDFARSKRQQQVIAAIYDQLKSTNFISNPTMLADLYKIFKKYVKTDITFNEAISFAKIALNFDSSKIYTVTIPNDDYGFLYTPSKEILDSVYNGMYVLLPSKKDFSQIHLLVDLYYYYSDAIQSKFKIALINTTNIQNLATECSEKIKRYGFNVLKPVKINKKDNYKESFIYDFSKKENSHEFIIALQKLFSVPLNKSLNEEFLNLDAKNNIDVDILIFLGKDAVKLCQNL